MTDAQHNLNLAYLCFFAFITLSLFLQPEGLIADHGFSYYGGLFRTILPYALAFGSAAYFLYQASRSLNDEASRLIGRMFRFFAYLLIGLIFMPHDVWPFSLVHTILGALLFFFQLVLVGRLAAAKADPIIIGSAATMVISGLLCAFYLILASGYLIETQAIYQIGFWIGMNRRLSLSPGI
ncbi:hypothetical protein KGQ71_05240 [Patescibacteria group bacterium]|nr:hypothetical protein [Patescibacteria group bacterium]